jgi:hypothetical protein
VGGIRNGEIGRKFGAVDQADRKTLVGKGRAGSDLRLRLIGRGVAAAEREQPEQRGNPYNSMLREGTIP